MLKTKTQLYSKIDELELETKTLKSMNNILQFQLDQAIHDLWVKNQRIKEMEKDGRISKK